MTEKEDLEMRLGFIGCGNMAGAIIGGIIGHNVCEKEAIIGSDPLEAGRARVQENHGIRVTADNKEVVKDADIVFLAVKPQYYESVLEGEVIETGLGVVLRKKVSNLGELFIFKKKKDDE